MGQGVVRDDPDREPQERVDRLTPDVERRDARRRADRDALARVRRKVREERRLAGARTAGDEDRLHRRLDRREHVLLLGGQLGRVGHPARLPPPCDGPRRGPGLIRQGKNRLSGMGGLWTRFGAVAGALVIAFVASIIVLNQTVYTPVAFVRGYLDALARHDVGAALALAGPLPSSSAVDDLLTAEVLGDLESYTVEETAAPVDGVHLVAVSYVADGHEGRNLVRGGAQRRRPRDVPDVGLRVVAARRARAHGPARARLHGERRALRRARAGRREHLSRLHPRRRLPRAPVELLRGGDADRRARLAEDRPDHHHRRGGERRVHDPRRRPGARVPRRLRDAAGACSRGAVPSVSRSTTRGSRRRRPGRSASTPQPRSSRRRRPASGASRRQPAPPGSRSRSSDTSDGSIIPIDTLVPYLGRLRRDVHRARRRSCSHRRSARSANRVAAGGDGHF